LPRLGPRDEGRKHARIKQLSPQNPDLKATPSASARRCDRRGLTNGTRGRDGPHRRRQLDRTEHPPKAPISNTISRAGLMPLLKTLPWNVPRGRSPGAGRFGVSGAQRRMTRGPLKSRRCLTCLKRAFDGAPRHRRQIKMPDGAMCLPQRRIHAASAKAGLKRAAQ